MKWLQERANGSKIEPLMPPRRASRGVVPSSLDSGTWNNRLAEMWRGSEEGSYLRLTDCCVTQF
jgi:hypothetical protein